MAEMKQLEHVIIDRDQIKETIENAVRNNFGEGTVSSIDIGFNDDDVDVDVVNVAVILNRPVNKNQLSGFGLKLRNELDRLNSGWFPLVSFIAKNEYTRRRTG